MRIRTTVTALLLAAAATVAFAGVASAQPSADRDCRDFTSRAAAQRSLDAAAGDPQRLDADGDGTACEDYFGQDAVPPPVPVDRPVANPAPADPPAPRPGAAPAGQPAPTVPQIPVKPQGAPDTGDGSVVARDTAPFPAVPAFTGPAAAAPLDAAPPEALAAGLGAVAALAAVYLVVARTPNRPRRTSPADRRRGGRRSARGVPNRWR